MAHLISCRFGAVLEEFEVRDALENVFTTKPEGFARFAFAPAGMVPR